MAKTLTDLHEVVLLQLLENYLPLTDLIALGQVSRKLRQIVHEKVQWTKIYRRNLFVSFPMLKTNSACPQIKNLSIPRSVLSESLAVPSQFRYSVILNNRNSIVRQNAPREPDSSINCTKTDCGAFQLLFNYPKLSVLSRNYCNKSRQPRQSPLVQFSSRAETSIVQYDEHNHNLWYNYRSTLECLNLRTKRVEKTLRFDKRDISCHKLFPDDYAFVAHGENVQVVKLKDESRFRYCSENHFDNHHINDDDIFSLDVSQSDGNRYLIATGSRRGIVSMKVFDPENFQRESVWRTEIDQVVYSCRFTMDSRFLLAGIGARVNVEPVVLFDVERPQPLHAFNGKSRRGAGVRCIEWVSENVFLAGGFDCQCKEFDLRTGKHHFTYEDILGNDVFSISVPTDGTDLSSSVFLGANRYSTVVLFNRRQRRVENVFYTSIQSSPIHSLIVTPEFMLTSLDRSIVATNFGARSELVT